MEIYPPPPTGHFRGYLSLRELQITPGPGWLHWGRAVPASAEPPPPRWVGTRDPDGPPRCPPRGGAWGHAYLPSRQTATRQVSEYKGSRQISTRTAQRVWDQKAVSRGVRVRGEKCHFSTVSGEQQKKMVFPHVNNQKMDTGNVLCLKKKLRENSKK